MDMQSVFKQLAQTTASSEIEITQLLNMLPSEIKNSYIKGDIHRIRQQISGSVHYADAKTVVKE